MGRIINNSTKLLIKQVYTIFGDIMKKKITKVVVPIFLAVLSGFLCGRLMFSIYEEKGSNTLNSNLVYLLMDTTYNSYDDMKANTISSNYIYYEDKGKYNVVVAITQNKDNITKIEEVYNKKLDINKYLINDNEVINKLKEYDNKLNNSSDKEEIKSIVNNMNTIYKDKEDIKMVKIS